MGSFAAFLISIANRAAGRGNGGSADCRRGGATPPSKARMAGTNVVPAIVADSEIEPDGVPIKFRTPSQYEAEHRSNPLKQKGRSPGRGERPDHASISVRRTSKTWVWVDEPSRTSSATLQ